MVLCLSFSGIICQKLRVFFICPIHMMRHRTHNPLPADLFSRPSSDLHLPHGEIFRGDFGNDLRICIKGNFSRWCDRKYTSRRTSGTVWRDYGAGRIFWKKLRRVVRNYEKGNPFRWTAFLSMAASCVRLFSAPTVLNLKFQFLVAYTLKLNWLYESIWLLYSDCVILKQQDNKQVDLKTSYFRKRRRI